MHITSVPARQHQAGVAQGFQVLGKIGLPPAKGGFQVTNTGLIVTDGQQNLQPGILPDSAEKNGNRFNCGYIRHNEYIVAALR